LTFCDAACTLANTAATTTRLITRETKTRNVNLDMTNSLAIGFDEKSDA
jgi:hypothetical protein